MAWLQLTCHHYCRPTNLGGIYDLRVNISWWHIVIAWKVLASVVLRMPPLLSGTRSPAPSSVPSPLTFSRAIWRHICLISHIHNCDVTFLSYCVYFPSFCLVSVWYHKRFWAWRLVAVEIGAIENWHYYYYYYCYESNKEGLREWIRGVDNAVPWTGSPDALVLEMVGYLATGSLGALIQEHMAPNNGPHTWAECRALLFQHFWNEDEQEYLRAKVETVVQNAYEDTREYGMRFKDAVRKAYSNAELAVLLFMERLVNSYINGVRDKVGRMQVYLAKPVNIDQAITVTNNAARAVSKAECNSRTEEPMEVGVLVVPGPSTAQASRNGDNQAIGEMRQLVKTLQGEEVKSLHPTLDCTQVRIPAPEATPPPPPPTARPIGRHIRPERRQPSCNAKGEPQCYNCHRCSHMAWECRQEEAIVTAVETAVAARLDRQEN